MAEQQGKTQSDIFLGMMLFSRDQAHVWHLQTTSYSEHRALNAYYDNILELIDAFAESWMGSYLTRMKESPIPSPKPYSNSQAITDHLRKVSSYLYNLREEVKKYPCLQNIIDEMHSVIYKTEYLLTLK